MKKHNEGYVLIYVTVVLILFSLIGSMILTSAMKNLNAQQAAITQMQDKYAAQGMIEQVIARVSSNNLMETDNLWNTGVACEFLETGDYQLVATHQSIVIICVIDGDGDIKEYTITTAATEPTETGVPGT